MTNEYSHSAFSYATTWLWYDRPTISALSWDSPEPSEENACQALTSFANEYKVSRCFKTIDESLRLVEAWRAIKGIERPSTPEEAKSVVRKLVDLLFVSYGNEPWSAASKFLWIRFRYPIIIYDSKTWEWLKREGKLGSFPDWNSAYSRFCDVWRTKYLERREDIRLACEGMLQVRDYLPPIAISDGKFVAIPDSELEDAVRSEWFMERVFDTFMLNQESYPRIGTDGAK